MRNLREGVIRGDHMPPFPADQCGILHGSQIVLIDRGEGHFNCTLDSSGIPFPSSKCVLKDNVRDNMYTSRMKGPLASSQSRTSLSMQEFSSSATLDEARKRKYTDISGYVADNCTMTLNVCCSDYDGRWRETRRTPEVGYKDTNLEFSVQHQGRSFEGNSVHVFSGFDDGYNNKHRHLSEPWVPARSAGIMNGALSDRMTDNGWRDRKMVDKIESKYLDPDFPRYSKTSRVYGDHSQEVFASRLLTRSESKLLDIRHPETCRSRFRTAVDRCRGSLGRTVNSHLTGFHETEMDDNRWKVDSKYHNFSNLEQFCNSTNFTNDSLRKVADDNSEYINEYASEIWAARSSGGLSKIPGTGSHYTSSIWGEEMRENSRREKIRFSSTYETYPDAEHSRTLQIKHGKLENQSVLLSYDESNQQSELNENSEEFKQRVHIAHLRFSKMLSEDSNQKNLLQGQSESGSLICIVCGR